MRDLAAVSRMSKAIDLLVVTVCTLAFVLNAGGILTSLLTDGFAGKRDFLTYWCSAVQLVRHADPYGAAGIQALERAAGFPPGIKPLIMRNAPYALVAVFPLGFLTLRIASLVWSFCMIGAAWWSIRLIAELYGGKGKIANLLAIAFAPLLSCLISGQISLFALLGLTLFLRFVHSRPGVAGAALWLCALKPQVFVPFGVVLLLWSLRRKQWSLLLGASIPFLISSSVVWLLDPWAWREYFAMMSAAALPDKFVPCLSMVIRLVLWPDAVWLQFVPMALGCAWALMYSRSSLRWDWRERAPLLILVSVWTAPYSWFMDQSILLAALLPILYRPVKRPVIWLFVMLSAGVECANLFGLPLGDKVLYPWTATAWFAWYLWAVHLAPIPTSVPVAAEVSHVTIVPPAVETTVTR